MRRERKENQAAMLHYVKWYECASLNTFWPAMMLLCRSANAVVRWCVPAEVDAAFLAREPYNLLLSLAEDVLSIISKPNARLDWRTGFDFEC